MNPQSVSRRNWFGLAAAAGIPAAVAAAPQDSAPSDLGTRTYNITAFGAKGDGKTLDTAAVQAAIDACHRDRGGTVLVPAGVFAIGTVELKSFVTLHISAGGTLLGSADGKQYRAASAIPLSGDTTLNDGNVGLIFAVDAERVTIEGAGTIDGQGAAFRSPVRGTPPPSGRGGADRPYHLLFHRCNNLRVRDITLVESAFHSIRAIQSHYVWMQGLHIHNRVNGNNDGFHFVSCEYLHVDGCDVQSQDDACALFGSCKFVTVSNSTFSTRWSVFRFGGGNPENVTISNCTIYECYGCPIKMQFGRESKVRNLLFSNLIMQDVTGPISINLNDRARPNVAQTGTGYVRGIAFRGIRARVVAEGGQFSDIAFKQNYRPGEMRQCIVINAIGNAEIEDVSFDDVQVAYGGGGTAEEASREMPQAAAEYFEVGPPTAYGLYARNVRGLTLNNVRFTVEKADLRPAVVLDHVSDAAIGGLAAQGNPQAKAVVRTIEAKDVLFTSPRVLTPGPAFLMVEGAASHGIALDGGQIEKAASAVVLAAGAMKDSVRVR